MLRAWRRNREHRSKPEHETVYLEATEGGCVRDPEYREWLDCLRTDHDHGLCGVGDTQRNHGWQRDYWYPAQMRPNECLWDRDFNCVRDDHQHGDGSNE